MTKDLKDLVPAQEKLEWVTPKISQLVAGDTEGKIPFTKELKTRNNNAQWVYLGS